MVTETHYTRLLTPPKGSFFLFGVRGVGKSTWIREALPGAHVIDLLDESRYQRLLAEPGLLALELRALPRDRVVVLDEVQRIPALLNEVHRAIESDRRRFALLGSSARRLKTADSNLLAGRATVRTMYPLAPAELGDAFDLERVLRTGSVPLVWRSDDPPATLDAYVNLYIREEIRAEALVRNLPAFLRFLPAAALFHGQTINIAGLARDAAAARKTVEGYLAILQDTLLATLLPAFEPRLRVRERQHPKLYWVDPGIVRAARRDLGAVGAEERGSLFEGWLLTVLRAHNEVSRLYDEISYWAPAQARHTEVDFVLRRGREHLALEVKARPRFAADQLTGLRAIADLPRLARRVLVYLGDRSLKTEDGIEVWPLDRFLRAVASDALWP
ncbi:MAG TPA: ATP-binding protein [Candidatus Limnocylindria bacterium]|nr:ATP-binding protein [Candidatus Limnocylindria bacterium]